MSASSVLHGDCVEVLATIPDASIDACVTDPPYGIGFMGKEWDTFTPGYRKEWDYQQDPRNSPALHAADYDRSLRGMRAFQAWTETWATEVLRVLKPGGYAVVCGAPRAYHRMACGLEDAGFEIRDCFAWLFGSGFPKSLNLGNGLGTALKPAHEPIVLARKPFKGTVKANVATHGTGALNIDVCRIPFASDEDQAVAAAAQRAGHDQNVGRTVYGDFNDGPGSIEPYLKRMDMGRWPANVVLDEIAARVLDAQSGYLLGCDTPKTTDSGATFMFGIGQPGHVYGDAGGASRFYYVAKPSREERDYGCSGLATRTAGECTDRKEGSDGLKNPRAGAGRTGGHRNFHPTVKPVELMRWLVKLVTPPGGTVLDPFCGSGTTGMACVYEQRSFIGIERERDYIEIAERRIRSVAPLFIETSA